MIASKNLVTLSACAGDWDFQVTERQGKNMTYLPLI